MTGFRIPGTHGIVSSFAEQSQLCSVGINEQSKTDQISRWRETDYEHPRPVDAPRFEQLLICA